MTLTEQDKPYNNPDVFIKKLRPKPLELKEGEAPIEVSPFLRKDEVTLIAQIFGKKKEEVERELSISGEDLLDWLDHNISLYILPDDDTFSIRTAHVENQLSIFENMHYFANILPASFRRNDPNVNILFFHLGLDDETRYENLDKELRNSLPDNIEDNVNRRYRTQILETFFKEVLLRVMNPDAFPNFTDFPTLKFTKDTNGDYIPSIELPKADFDLNNTAQLLDLLDLENSPENLLGFIDSLVEAWECYSNIGDRQIQHLDISPGNIGIIKDGDDPNGYNIVFLDNQTASTANTQQMRVEHTPGYADETYKDKINRLVNFDYYDQVALSRTILFTLFKMANPKASSEEITESQELIISDNLTEKTDKILDIISNLPINNLTRRKFVRKAKTLLPLTNITNSTRRNSIRITDILN